jgi:NAD(P)-dependent dehydrogenase (short-subunit alcohol dehydrogenase family)
MAIASPTSPAVLITGASSGIGAACAVALDRLGWQVFAGVRSKADGQRLAEMASPRLRPVLIDVTDEATIANAARMIGQALGGTGLSGLVNNAGIVVPGPVEAVPMDMVRRQFDVNVIGQVAVTQAMLPLLRVARGRIVNIGSVSGRIASPFLGFYAASKYALEALTDSLRVELRHWNILISIVEPGAVVTPIWAKSQNTADQVLKDIPPEMLELYGRDIETFRATTARLGDRGMPVERVVRAVIHAMTARRPKSRYPLGVDTRVAIALFPFLPERLRDWIVRRSLGLS